MRVDPQPPPPPFPGYFAASSFHKLGEEDAELFSQLAVQGRAERIAEVLRCIEPSLTAIEVQVSAGTPTLWAVLNAKRRLPVALMGQGVVKLTHVGIRIAQAENGVVLYDEIENGIHHSVMYDVWRGVAELAREVNCQVFATTHSRECIQAAHEAFTDSKPYDLRLHRLDRIEDTIEAVTYDEETLQAAIELEHEVR